MAERFDLQPAWRERYGMDEFGVARLRKTVTRASASLPSVIFWALGPKDPGQGMAFAAVAAVALTVVGLRGVVRLEAREGAREERSPVVDAAVAQTPRLGGVTAAISDRANEL